MIEPELAKKFIERLTQYTDYNINIMNESGVIIASRDPSRVGTYHEVADRIIRGEQDMIVIRDDKEFPGVLPGINMAITHQGRKEGVIGVTGEICWEVANVTSCICNGLLFCFNKHIATAANCTVHTRTAHLLKRHLFTDYLFRHTW